MKVDVTAEYRYKYDKLYQLIDVNYPVDPNVYYYYDKLGNRTSVVNGGTTNYTSNKLNQYICVGGTNYYYDPNGNLTYDGTRTYSYDCENHMIKSTLPNQRYYKYDFSGRRVRKHYLSNMTRYCYDGDQVIAEYNYFGNLQRKYVYGLGIDEPVCMINVAGGNAVYYYHFDGLGSVIALSNGNGQIVEKYSYSAFGEPNRTSSVGNPYMFTGRNYDSETKLYYYRARYYNPSIGRFMQTDPVGYVKGLNLYTYVLNNPVNLKDPTGGCSEAPVIPPELIEEIPVWIIEEGITKTVGYAAGAACASRACKRGLNSQEVYDKSLDICAQIFYEYQLPPGIGINDTAFLFECTEVCDKISKTKAYKKHCGCE